MNQKNLKPRCFLLVAALFVVMNLCAAVRQTYAVYDSWSHTLIFYYDDQKDARTGWVLNVYTGRLPDWHETNLMEDVQTVRIDKSFADRKLTNGSYLFAELRGLCYIDGLEYLDTSKMTNMAHMFSQCGSYDYADLDLDLRTFDTKNVTDMESMFYGCHHLKTLDLTSFDTQNVKNMKNMFEHSTDLTSIFVSNRWTTASLTNTPQRMFSGCVSLVGGAGTAYVRDYDKSDYARIDQGESAPGYLTYKAFGYNLWIGNTQVDEDNFENITSDEIKTGSISYNPDTRTLTLNGVNYEGELPGITNGSPHNYFQPGIDGLKIVVKGMCYLCSTAKSAFHQEKGKVTITGSGHLRLRSEESCAMMLFDDVTLKDAYVQAVGKDYSIRGNNYDGGLIIDHSTLVAYSLTDENETFMSVSNFELIDSHFSDVELAGTIYDANLFYFDTEEHTIYYGTPNVDAVPWHKEVFVEPDKFDLYNLCVGDIQVNIRNKDDILGDGTVSFDPSTNTLTLENADITNTGNEGYGICNYLGNGPLTFDIDVKDLTVNLLGKNKINTDDVCLYINRADLTLKGTGELLLNSSQEDAINVRVCGLTLLDTHVYAKGCDSAIKGTGSTLTVNHSLLDAWSTYGTQSTIYDFNELQLIESYFDDIVGYDTFLGENFYYDDGSLVMWYDGDYYLDEGYGGMSYYSDVYTWEVLISPTKLPTAITSPEVRSDSPAYNLSGQRISEDYRGIVIKDGKKFLRK